MDGESEEADMRGKLLFVAGVAGGYVVGARAGRPAYEAVLARFRRYAGSPAVQRAGEKAKDTLQAKAPKLADVAGKAASTASGAAAAASAAGADAGTDATPAAPSEPAA
jgi:hypothetical protein